MSLTERLGAIRQERLKGAAAEAYAEVLQRFDSGQMLENALAPGQSMPPFELPDSNGRLVSSTQLLQKGPLIVTFYRGSWCPYCMVALEALEELRMAFASEKVTVVALSPETGGRAAAVRSQHKLNFDVLTDVDNAIAAQFGVLVRLPQRYRELLASKGIDADQWHGNASWFVPLPASFVIAPDGTVVHSEVHVDFTYRTEPATLPRALRELNAVVQKRD